jgi:hypothetical protein
MRGELVATGKGVWLPVDIDFVDWTAQFKALDAAAALTPSILKLTGGMAAKERPRS